MDPLQHETNTDVGPDDDIVRIGSSDVQEYNPGHILPQPADGQNRIVNWLGPTEYDAEGSEYQKHLSLHVLDTCDWIVSHQAYQQWHDRSGPGVLWIRGVPGSGKSVLAATMIRRLDHEEVPVLYFFCRHIAIARSDHQTGPAAAAIRDWLCQILPFSPPLQIKLQERVDTLGGQSGAGVERLSLAELFGLLRTALAHLPRVYILIDALDEMDPVGLEPLLGHLGKLAAWRPGQVRLILTSRPVGVVETMMQALPHVLDIRLERQHFVAEDIALYVERRLGRSSLPPEVHARVAETVLERCDGLFLYARLALDQVLGQPSLHINSDHVEVTTQAATMPSDLLDVYTEMVREQQSRRDLPVGMQQFLHECVTYAMRPLRLLELADLINMKWGLGDLGRTKNLVRSACAPLLEVRPDESIHVIHHSVTEFLKGMAMSVMNEHHSANNDATPSAPGSPHGRLALCCIDYLGRGCLDSIEVTEEYGRTVHRVARTGLTPFALYAATQFAPHAQRAVQAGYDATELDRKMLRLLLTGPNAGTISFLCRALYMDGRTPLGLATWFGLNGVVRGLLDLSTSQDVRMEYGDKNLALIRAAEYGHEELVSLLLQYGAKATSGDESGYTALHYAVRQRQQGTARVLLEAGVDPFIRERTGRFRGNRYMVMREEDRKEEEEEEEEKELDDPETSPYSYAIQQKDVDLVSLMIPYLQSEERVGQALEEALGWMVYEVIQLLLRHPHVNVNRRTCCYSRHSHLYMACTRRDARSIELLLQAGADPNMLYVATDDDDEDSNRRTARVGYCAATGCSAIHALASGRDARVAVREPRWTGLTCGDDVGSCLKLLLDAGARLDQVDVSGNTPLHVARDVEAVECLLEAGLDPSIANHAGETLFDRTVDHNILRLLAGKVDIKAQASTQLLCILRDTSNPRVGQIRQAHLLLDLGADATAVDDVGEGNGVIHYFALMGGLGTTGVQLLERLVEEGADVNLRNRQGQTPLHQCRLPLKRSLMSRAHEGLNIVQVLVAVGADLEARDHRGRTPLFAMMAKRRENMGTKDKIEACQAMMAAGARLDTTDLQGMTPLHCLLRHRWPDMSLIHFFISQGLDPHAVDKEGNTMWHMTASVRATAPLDLQRASELTALGVDPCQLNHYGQSPLHIIVQFHPSAFRPRFTVSEASLQLDKRPEYADAACFFDYFLSLVQTVDGADRNGVTPLHIASTFSEYLTRRLLERGADPTRHTSEGLTVLHLAARSRQGNVLGMVLAWFRAASPDDDSERKTSVQLCNVRDRLGRTPLYYACASGRVSLVKMLLEAGAVVDTESFDGSPWQGCLALQEEETMADWRWHTNGAQSNEDDNEDGVEPDAGGVMINDTQRPKLDLDYRSSHHDQLFLFPTERLTEIIHLLVVHGPVSGTRFVDEALTLAMETQYTHAVERFLRARARLGVGDENGETVQLDETTATSLAALSRAHSAAADRIRRHLESLVDKNPPDMDASTSTPTLTLTPEDTMLHSLVMSGYAGLLDELATSEVFTMAARRMPLLVEACRSEQPNMDVVRVLVENKGLDVNQGALHALVRGSHWWQIHEALPYLLSRGADTEVKNRYGVTPLAAALDASRGPHFSKAAVEILLQAGADAEAIDLDGQTCLSRLPRASHADVAQLLFRHMTTVTPSMVLDIISLKDVTLLASLLKGGLDPNLPPSPPNNWYPLEMLVYRVSDHVPEAEAMLQLLLDYGADPCARYDDGTTIMHRILSSPGGLVEACLQGKSRFLSMLLNSTRLNLEATTSNGETLLLCACARNRHRAGIIHRDSHTTTLIQLLLDAGSDARARDHRGLTALHILSESDNTIYSLTRDSDVHRLLVAAPDLVHIVDHEGRAPLHAACASRIKPMHVEGFIRAGADVMAKILTTGDTALHLLFRQQWAISTRDEVNVEDDYNISYRRDGEWLRRLRPPTPDPLRLLLGNGGDVNARNKEGETPVFGYFRNAKVTARLLDDDDEAEDNSGSGTEAQEASIDKEQIIWDFFDRIGVDWTAVNNRGETLLHVVPPGSSYRYVPSTQSVNRFRFLMSKGLDPMKEDKQHRTPIDVAASLGRADIQALFE